MMGAGFYFVNQVPAFAGTKLFRRLDCSLSSSEACDRNAEWRT